MIKGSELRDSLNFLSINFEKTISFEISPSRAFEMLISEDIKRTLNSFYYLPSIKTTTRLINNFYDIPNVNSEINLKLTHERARVYAELWGDYLFIPIEAIIKDVKEEFPSVFVDFDSRCIKGFRPARKEIEISIQNIDGDVVNLILRKFEDFFPDGVTLYDIYTKNGIRPVNNAIDPVDIYTIKLSLDPHKYDKYGVVSDYLQDYLTLYESSHINKKELLSNVAELMNKEYRLFANRALGEFYKMLMGLELQNFFQTEIDSETEKSKEIFAFEIVLNQRQYLIDFQKCLEKTIPFVKVKNTSIKESINEIDEKVYRYNIRFSLDIPDSFNEDFLINAVKKEAA